MKTNQPTMTLTIEALEQLSREVEATDAAEHTRLLRFCGAMGKILAHRQPDVWKATCTSITDVAGHFDNSYPPKAERHGRGPSVVIVRARVIEDVPTEGGFHYAWRRQTTDGGCYLGHDGAWYRADESGTGRVGPFAAYPGDCDRDITVEWVETTPTLEDLRQAEPALRDLMAAYLGGSEAA
jgi:hypothetical protein